MMANGLSRDDEDLLADLLVQWEDTWDAGQEKSAEELCANTPHLVEPLKKRMAVLKELAWLKKDPARPLTGDLSAESKPLTGVLQDRYRLDARIGQGGYGQVYKAFDLQLHRPVAVKIAHICTSTDLLMDEARRVARLRHPGIVTVHDVGEHKGRLFLVFDLVEGASLADVLRKRRLSMKESVDLVAEVAMTLHYAHERNCIHRDIKPENILIDSDGRPLVADFGVAVTLEELSKGQSLSQGTLPYMAPEQVAGEAHLIDRHVDIYALGVVLYELLTGRLPFEAVDTATLREEILFRSPKPLRSVKPSVPVDLERICQKCMSRHPSDRFTTAEELALALRSTPLIPWWHWRSWLAIKWSAR
jgi:eukaryotic-like serine/threonine-protein kinase